MINKSQKDPKNKVFPPISLVITVLNEQNSILSLLKALEQQTYRPKETIIIDGGSKDETIKLIKQFQNDNPNYPLIFKSKPGFNISQGRNWGIHQAKNKIIALTDAGCIPQVTWLEKLCKTYLETRRPVIAGYYFGLGNTSFEKAVVPYVLVMPDQIDPDHFLPASRSMLLEKKVWKQLGGFPEELRVSEDFSFAHKIKDANIPIAFCQEAKVGWQPRSNLKDFFLMIFAFARGDILAGITRTKVIFVFLRYFMAIILSLFLLAKLPTLTAFAVISTLGLFYLSWAVVKNCRYTPEGWYWLPILQISADVAVMSGTLSGKISKIKQG